jgi:hypothetical protein
MLLYMKQMVVMDKQHQSLLVEQTQITPLF